MVTNQLDWRLFLALTKRHRVEGLAYRALREAGIDLPGDIFQKLADKASAIAAENLVNAAESHRLKRMLEGADIPFLFLKGVTLAALIYRDLGVKQAWDIDLLVDSRASIQAAAALRDAGYRLVFPSDVPDERLGDWMALCKESLWLHPGPGTYVELHTALVDNPDLLPLIGVHSERQTVVVAPSLELPTLAKDELYAYLCVHGAAHGWSRLKWLADVASFLSALEPEEIKHLHNRSVELGGGRSSAQALLLCSSLLAQDLPPELEQDLLGSRANRWLVKIARNALTRLGSTELDDTMFGTSGINISHFFLKKEWSYKFREIKRKGSHPEDRFLLSLPAYLHFLYPMLAVPLWIWRRFRLDRA